MNIKIRLLVNLIILSNDYVSISIGYQFLKFMIVSNWRTGYFVGIPSYLFYQFSLISYVFINIHEYSN